jgi:hypothetical protein
MLEFYPCVAHYEMFMISKHLNTVSSLTYLCPWSLLWNFIYCLHSRISQGSREIADERARQGSVHQFVGSEPTLGMDNQYMEMWQGNTSTQRQTRKLISDRSLTVKTKLLSFDRTQSGAVTSLLTGHNTLRNISTKWGRSTVLHEGGEWQRRKPQLTYCLSVKPWRHIDMHIWALFLGPKGC